MQNLYKANSVGVRLSEIKYVVATLFTNHKLFLVLLKSIFTITRPVWLSSLNPSLTHTHITLTLTVYIYIYTCMFVCIDISPKFYKMTILLIKCTQYTMCLRHASTKYALPALTLWNIYALHRTHSR
jgi:hypothetical protein